MKAKFVVAASAGMLLTLSVNTVIGIVYKLPFQFGGTGNPDTMVRDAFFSGTLISPPILTMLIFATLTILATRSRWQGIVGLVGVGLISTLFIIAGSGEPPMTADQIAAMPALVLSVLNVTGVISLGCTIAALLFSIIALWSRRPRTATSNLTPAR